MLCQKRKVSSLRLYQSYLFDVKLHFQEYDWFLIKCHNFRGRLCLYHVREYLVKLFRNF